MFTVVLWTRARINLSLCVCIGGQAKRRLANDAEFGLDSTRFDSNRIELCLFLAGSSLGSNLRVNWQHRHPNDNRLLSSSEKFSTRVVLLQTRTLRV